MLNLNVRILLRIYKAFLLKLFKKYLQPYKFANLTHFFTFFARPERCYELKKEAQTDSNYLFRESEQD